MKDFLKKNTKAVVILGVITALLVWGWCSASSIIMAMLTGGSPADDVALEAMKASNMCETGDAITFNSEGTQTGFIFYPGGMVNPAAYAPMMKTVSDAGFLTVIVKMPLQLAVLNSNLADKVMEQHPEIEHWYLGGHSLGGVTACMYADRHRDKLEGLILLAAYSTKDLKDSGLKVLSLYGSEDKVLNMERYAAGKKRLPEEFREIVIEGGCHGYMGNYGEQVMDGIPTISREEQQTQVIEAILEMIR